MNQSLKVSNLNISSKFETIIKNLSFEIEVGNILSIIGPSGIGKSTILSWISASIDKTSFRCEGEISLLGRNLKGIPQQKREIGILYQDDLLFPHFTVYENLLIAIRPAIANPKQAIHQALSQAELLDLISRYPKSLSGGQKARISLLRLLLYQPKLLLLDEPFSKLDSHNRKIFRNFVFEQCKAKKFPILMVSHDQEDITEAANYFKNNKTIYLKK